jgi:endonuclease/exonuclease/phosphatase family metal-dependent hydrolase
MMKSRVTRRTALASLLCAAISWTGCQSTTKQTESRTFRVMTYNIHHAEGLDGKVDLLRIAELIKREGADIVALQEVDKGVERTARRDLPDELAELTGMTCVFSNNYNFQGGEYGNAVLTRFPIKRWTNTHYQKVNETEQRGLLQLTLDVRGREIVFMATHIDHRPDDAARWSNVREIEELVKSKPLTRPADTLSPSDGERDGVSGRSIILCGDFNDTPDSRVCRRMNELLDDAWSLVGTGDGFTIPAEKPRKRIDYIWISKDKSLAPLKVWVPRSDASDHLPVLAEFRLR